MAADAAPRLTFLQRRALRSLAKVARKHPGEPLGPEDWGAYWAFGAQPVNRAVKWMLRALPSSPRCGFCGAPFGGVGRRIVGPLGYRPSRKKPDLCSMCVELAPPGGMTMEAGILFADLRGFTTLSDGADPAATGALLRRFYGAAEKVLLPEALIDKLIGDAVMALYIPPFMLAEQRFVLDDAGRRTIAETMVGHARALLDRVGSFAEAGVGLDFGEVFVGNIGDTALQDFTAVGDVVNTASRLQGAAAGGEILVSERLARHLGEMPGAPESLAVKGKAEPVRAYRLKT